MKKILATLLLAIMPFVSKGASQEEELRQNLRLLYRDTPCEDTQYCYSKINEDKMLQEAIAFKQRFDQLVQNKTMPKVTWRQVAPNAREFEFDSLYVREANNPANKVKGIIYFPKIQGRCDVQMPATLLIHKLSTDIDDEKQVGSIASTLNSGIVMIMYLPGFGPRAQEGEPFLNSNFDKFENNIMQSIVDIHVANQILKTLPEVKKDDIGLMGFSLGAFTSLISAGIDPIFDRYATNVGGGDMANLFEYKKSGDTTSMTGSALATVDWTVDKARFKFSRFDAITWSHQVRNKKILMINANSDEIISKKLSVDKTIEAYKSSRSRVQLIMHDGTHAFKLKDVGILKTISKVLYPMLNFMKGEGYDAYQCQSHD